MSDRLRLVALATVKVHTSMKVKDSRSVREAGIVQYGALQGESGNALRDASIRRHYV